MSALLIAQFGSIARILSVSDERLAAALEDYPGAAEAICSARRLVHVGLAQSFEGECVDIHDRRLVAYLSSQLCNVDEERLFAVFLDGDGRFLSGELLSRGSRTGVEMHCRAIVQRALDLGAASILLAHNHCSGDSRPSAKDIAATRHLQAIVEAMEIDLVDHLVLGQGEVFSIGLGKKL